MQNPSAKPIEFSVQAEGDAYLLCANGKAMQTPGKNALALPTKPLADAICWEWQSGGKFTPARMPLTSLAYTAIDRIAGQEAAIVEALLVYLDTDTLSYRDSGENRLLRERQLSQWNPVLDWAASLLGEKIEVTSGIMPLDQAPELHAAFKKNIENLDVMRLSALSVLASCCSSVLLALAVVRGYIDGQKAYVLSRLEEDTQAEIWGRDEEASERAERLKNEIVAAGRFLSLLERQ